MTIDIEALEKKLAIISGKIKGPSPGESGFRFWKPKESHVVRLVPHDPQFVELCFHYDIDPNGAVLCPNTYSKPCSICKTRVRLYQSGTDEDREIAKKLKNVWRFYAPIIVREADKEESDLKPVWWTFSRTVYEKIIEFCKDPDYGDISDPVSGCDLKVTLEKPKSEQGYPKTSVLPKKSCPLVKSQTELSRLTSEVTDMRKEVKEHTQEQLDKLLEAFLATATTSTSGEAPAHEEAPAEKSVEDVFKEISS